jgi:AraC-like DNA-binding protein
MHSLTSKSSQELVSSRPLRSLYLQIHEEYPRVEADWLGSCPEDLSREKILSDDLWIPYSWAFDLWREADKLCGDPLLGLKVGQRFDLARLDALGYACMSCKTLGEGYELTTRYYRLVESTVDLKVDQNDSSFVLRFIDKIGDKAPTLYNEYVAAAVFAGGCRAAGKRIPLNRVLLPHVDSQNQKSLQEYFGCPIEFGASEIAIEFPSEVYQIPMAQPDPAFKKMMEIEIARLLAYAPVSNPLLGQIQAFISVNLSHPNLSLDWLSLQLGMSGRTLDRRLRENGVTYTQLLDSVRSSVAKVLIQEARFSMSEIAFQLGFSELSVFTRSFKKWTGQSPSEYKNQPLH